MSIVVLSSIIKGVCSQQLEEIKPEETGQLSQDEYYLNCRTKEREALDGRRHSPQQRAEDGVHLRHKQPRYYLGQNPHVSLLRQGWQVDGRDDCHSEERPIQC